MGQGEMRVLGVGWGLQGDLNPSRSGLAADMAAIAPLHVRQPDPNPLPPSTTNQVTFIERRSSFLAFLTSTCAIVGGVFTISGIVDATVYHGQKMLRKKLEMGKQF